jgi:hypothetical protein
MSDPRRQQLNESWAANEERLQKAHDLKAGPEDPAEREAEIDREQDLIEGELGQLFLEERRQNGLARPQDER